jgi:AcrR family transcriptional regulator
MSFLDSDAVFLPATAVPDVASAAPPGETAASTVETGSEPAAETGSESAAVEDAMILTGPNTRIRAGNAMQRARAGAIRGALETLARRGLKRLTMAEAADRGGLARATLYNHVRDKESLIAMLLEHEAQAVAEAFVAAPTMESALVGAATMIAEHPALVGLREHEPAALVRLSVPDDGAVRQLAADALAARGSSATPADIDLVLRWPASFVASPSDPQARAAQAAALVRTLG